MRRFFWSVLLALLVGIGVGLIYSWSLSPKRINNASPVFLRADFKDQYRSVIAAAYQATGNLPRAQARLSLLNDSDPIEALNAQAQRMLASSEAFERADQVAALASALEGNTSQESTSGIPLSTLTVEVLNNLGNTLTPTFSPPPSDVPAGLTETPPSLETQPTIVETQPIATEESPRLTSTPASPPGEPFALSGQESICDANLPDGLLQVLVLNPNRRQIAGIEIVLTWDGGKEQFFTGLKPELGNGYADYLMTPDTTYTIQLARGSDVALGITAPTCQSPDGESFLGGIKLTFQQP
jgi:hypothetical protein